MKDDLDTPRRVFSFEPREFLRANRPSGEPQRDDTAADSGENPFPDSERPIDVRDMVRIATTDGPLPRTNAPANIENEVHGILRLNAESDRARGWYDVQADKDKKRRRRFRNYVIALFAINVPLGLIAWLSGHTEPFSFVSAIAAMTLLSAQITWETWFLRTD